MMKMLGSLFSKFFDVVIGFMFFSALTVFLGLTLLTLAVMCKKSGEIMENLPDAVVVAVPIKQPTSPVAEVELKKNWYARPENEGGAIVGRILAMAKESSSV